MYVCIEALELFTKLKLQNQPHVPGRAAAAGKEKDYQKAMWWRRTEQREEQSATAIQAT